MTAQALPDATAPPATPPATPPAAPFIATPAAPPAAPPATPPSHSVGATPISQLYRQLWHHAHGARGRMAAALAMLGSSQLLKLALPWLAAQAINSIQGHGLGGLPHAGWCIAGILALQVTSWALHGPARVLERNVAVRVRRSVADTLYGKLAQAPLAWHDQHHSGDLQHRVGQATGALYAFTQTQFVYLQNLINVVGPLLALTLLSPLTGAMAVVGMVLVGLAIVRFDGALMRLASQENDAERRYNARLLDFVGNMSAVVSLRLQAATRRLLDQRLLAVFKPLGRSIVLTEVKWCAVDLLTIALSWALVVAYALGSRHAGAGAAAGTELGAAAGTVMIGGLFMVYQYAQQAAGVLVSMAGNYQALARKQADFASADVIAAAPLPAPLPPALPADWNCIELHGLDYTHAASHGAASARGGVQAGTLQLRRGERIALVGPSGAGKSTLLRLLAGLYTAQAGRMTVDGRPQPGRLHLGDVATLIPQEADVFEASVRDNITLGDTVSDDALRAAVHTSALDAVLAQLPQGLDTPVSERGLNLSGGQRQRLALARGVLAVATHGSSLLLLDEPTSALDALTEAQVHLRLEETFGDACIVASVHRLGLLAHFDRVVFMQAGRIVDVGSVDELRQRQPVFAAMCAGVAGERAARPAQAAPAGRPALAVG